ncbi:MAG: permease, partial [Oscillospiraceae bacterium]|nr:permease [Oscillospiraceae bacterium]
FGLMAFLIGAGIPGGASFVKYFKPELFLYGVIMTLVPMIVGFFIAKYIIKLPLFNNLGGITGGMTSTPALGTLINVAKTDDVASAYAAAYPIALISIVLVSQFIITKFS